jgi:adenylate kinase
LFTRSDDNKDAIAQRLALYEEKTRPLLDYYAEAGRLRTVEGTGKPEQVQDRIASIVSAEDGAGEGGTSASAERLEQ